LTEKESKRAHLYISGRVQGVNFRYYTWQQALISGVTGWVRNLMDRRVEAVFEGDENSVQGMIDWCYKGPPSARVDQVVTYWEEPTGEFTDFEIRSTFF
jgi:acylphosphatase